MRIDTNSASHLLETAVGAVQAGPSHLSDRLDDLPAPVYVTDRHGTVTYFNKACVAFAGRTPEAGADKWCVTWKLYSQEGEPISHDRCPMAVAILEERPVRNVEAIAERPDGSRVHFIPYPTPVFDADGELAGAVNLLVDVTHKRTPAYLAEQSERCRRLASAITDDSTCETLLAMAARYDEQALKLVRPRH